MGTFSHKNIQPNSTHYYTWILHDSITFLWSFYTKNNFPWSLLRKSVPIYDSLKFLNFLWLQDPRICKTYIQLWYSVGASNGTIHNTIVDTFYTEEPTRKSATWSKACKQMEIFKNTDWLHFWTTFLIWEDSYTNIGKLDFTSHCSHLKVFLDGSCVQEPKKNSRHVPVALPYSIQAHSQTKQGEK